MVEFETKIIKLGGGLGLYIPASAVKTGSLKFGQKVRVVIPTIEETEAVKPELPGFVDVEEILKTKEEGSCNDKISGGE